MKNFIKENYIGILSFVMIGLFFGSIFYGLIRLHKTEMRQAEERKEHYESLNEKEKCLHEVNNTLNVEKKMIVIKTCHEIYE